MRHIEHKRVLVTGGAGFIGGNFVLDWLANAQAEGLVNLDKLTYAGNLQTLEDVIEDSRHVFVQGDIGDYDLVLSLLKKHQIYKFRGQGVSRTIENDIYNISNKSDVIMRVCLN